MRGWGNAKAQGRNEEEGGIPAYSGWLDNGVLFSCVVEMSHGKVHVRP